MLVNKKSKGLRSSGTGHDNQGPTQRPAVSCPSHPSTDQPEIV